MKRRTFLSSALILSLTSSRVAAETVSANAPASNSLNASAARLGQRLAKSAEPHELVRLRAILPSGIRPPLKTLTAPVAADFHAGRTFIIDGITFSETEAAWFLAAFDETKAVS